MAEIQEKIKKSLEEFKKLAQTMEKEHLDTKTINTLIHKLEYQSSPQHVTKTIPIPYQKGLHEIFTFYAKQQKISKPHETFDNFSDDTSHLYIGEFLVFCKDFSIYTQDGLSKSELMEIFKVNTAWKQKMNEYEFNLALQHIANKLFEGNSKESFSKLCELLHADDILYIKKYCKGFSLPFCPEKINFRTPNKNIKIPSDKNLPRVSKLILPRYSSTKAFSKHKKKVMVPCDAIVATVKKNSYSAYLLKKRNPMTFTWQTLSSLNTDQFQYISALSELVVEANDSDEEILSKHYGRLSPTLSNNSKK